MSAPAGIRVRRLAATDIVLAAATLALMAEVFDEPRSALSEAYVRRLLSRNDFWLLAALEEGRPVGGLTAFALPLTRLEASELFIYDLAVHPANQRRGIGRALVQELTAQGSRAGMPVTWVPADDGDEHALEFYRALGASESPVTIFTFGANT